jgi:hypothetical protein
MVPLSYEELREKYKKGLRNGNWRKLRGNEKGLYRAAMEYARKMKEIVNDMLVEKLSTLIRRLLETSGMRVFKRGFEKAMLLIEKYEQNGVFTWAPELKEWLKEPDYIFWLGTAR